MLTCTISLIVADAPGASTTWNPPNRTLRVTGAPFAKYCAPTPGAPPDPWIMIVSTVLPSFWILIEKLAEWPRATFLAIVCPSPVTL